MCYLRLTSLSLSFFYAYLKQEDDQEREGTSWTTSSPSLNFGLELSLHKVWTLDRWLWYTLFYLVTSVYSCEHFCLSSGWPICGKIEEECETKKFTIDYHKLTMYIETAHSFSCLLALNYNCSPFRECKTVSHYGHLYFVVWTYQWLERQLSLQIRFNCPYVEITVSLHFDYGVISCKYNSSPVKYHSER